MSKVGGVVIMHNGHNNYGTSLQGFATVKVVEKLGHTLRIIRYNKKRTLWDIVSTGLFLLMSGALENIKLKLKKKRDCRRHPEYAKNLKLRTDTVNRFKQTHFEPISDFYTGYKALCEGSKEYDVIFVGSDQVWGPLSLYSRFYNLLFVDSSIPHFSYASSFGVSDILPWQRKGVAEYLNKLNAIGVREIRGSEIVKSLTGRHAEVVADPTLLLSREEWTEYAAGSSMRINEPYIFCYILGGRSDIRREAEKLSRKTGLKLVTLNHVDGYEPADENFGDINPYAVDAFDFIQLLSHAQYVCTDSFHGTVFSLIFHRPFVTFYRQVPSKSKSTHSRIDSLLEIFGCQSRLFNFEGRDIFDVATGAINYDEVDREKDKLVERSLAFFRSNLNGDLPTMKCSDID